MKTEYLILIQNQRLVVDHNNNWLHQSEAFLNLPTGAVKEKVTLHKDNNKVVQVAEVSSELQQSQLLNFRTLISQVNPEEGRLISRALQLLTWKKQHRYCSQCGQSNRQSWNQQALICENCDLVYYPKISPCIMCLVTRGSDCLLAHHQRHPEGMYSTLAGFVEAGENLEQTLHREVLEEVGIKVKNLRYFSSQSWPFPNQLMIGYFAEYDSGDIVADAVEIEDAHWFHYSKLPQTPPATTLSGQLIKAFVESRKTVNRQNGNPI